MVRTRALRFKYFDKEKGISIYSFSDEKSRLFYSNAFSSSEREAAYVIDGLLHNDEVKSDIHSTDTPDFSPKPTPKKPRSSNPLTPILKNPKVDL